MINYAEYIAQFEKLFPELGSELPWKIVAATQSIIVQRIKTLGSDYIIQKESAIHKNAFIEEGVILKEPVIISDGCFVGAHAYIRGGVFLGERTVIGPGCEVKSSLIMARSALAHFNFVGDSIIGSDVNMEAGSIMANHFNERNEKKIFVTINKNKIDTEVEKFGALVGDKTKIGANAVLSPGTILPPGSIIKRLELVDQNGATTFPEYHF